MDKLKIENKIKEVAEKVAAENNLELVQVEVVGSERQLTVRVFIDKPNVEGGVTHEDCTTVSFNVGTILDVEDFIPSNYILEVSSPGIERELFKLDDYKRFAGESAKLKTRQPIDNQRNFRGKIVAVENETIVFDDKTNGRVLIPFSIVAKANLEFDYEAELKQGGKR
jgi:ribosome maturation factor RimP